MRVWDRQRRAYDDYGKAWGYALRDEDALRAGLAAFFGGASELRGRKPLLADVAEVLRALLGWCERQSSLVFVSSSLLFCYDGAADYADAAAARPRVEVRMIDFAHVRREDRADRGYIAGLRRVIRLIDDLHRSA